MSWPQKNDLRTIVEADRRYYYRTIKRLYPTFFADMGHGPLPFAPSLYCWLYNAGEIPLCDCGKRRSFISMKDGFAPYCSTTCAANSPAVKAKRVETTLQRFGVRNAHQSDLVKSKFYATMEQRYGTKHALQNAELCAKSSTKFKTNDQALIRAKVEQTNLARYGTRHASQAADIQEKRRNTSIARHGVDTKLRDPEVIRHANSLKRHEFLANISTRVNHVADALFKEFNGVNDLDGNRIMYPWRCCQCQQMFKGHLDDGHDPRCPICFPYAMSKGQAEIADFLSKISGETILGNDRNLIRPLELDIVIPNVRLAVEYHGLYYHHDGKVDRGYHLEKLNRCQMIDYRLIQIFENEWLFKRAIVEDRFKSFFKLNQRVFARKTTIQALSHQQAKSFFDETHLQGYCPASVRLGLCYNGSLVAAMSFGKPRFSKKYDFELLRYSSALGINVVGGASKLLAQFYRQYPTASLISYSDRRWNTGTVYEKIGLDYSHSSPPNYFYSRDKIRLLSRNMFQKHKLPQLLLNFNGALTEAENMYANGYVRLWDCGNDVFVKPAS